MLDGLKISEVNYLNLDNFILGSEFNSILKINSLKKLASNKKVSDYFELKTDIVSNIKNVLSYDLTHTLGNFIGDIEVSKHILGQRKLAKENDFIISRLRSYLQEFAVVEKRNNNQVFSSEYLVYRPTTNAVSSSLLVAYCLTKEVQTILNCSQYGTAHPRFFEFVFDNLPIPNSVLSLNNKINDIFLSGFTFREQSKTLHKEAEKLLLTELDLLDFEPSKENIAIKTFSESFADSGRLDSEYYQPKYDEIEKNINENSNKTIIKNEFNRIKTTFDKLKDGYNYIEIGNVNVSDGTNISNYVLTKDLPVNAKINVKDGDLLISTVRPNRGAITIVNTNEDDLIVSSAFTVLRKKENSKINIQVLQVLLRTNIYKELLLKYNVGTQYPVIKNEDVLNLLIPIIDTNIQTQIEQKIKQSFKLKEQSKQLLELAKQAVEVAIEQDEIQAIRLINEQI